MQGASLLKRAKLTLYLLMLGNSHARVRPLLVFAHVKSAQIARRAAKRYIGLVGRL